MDASADDYRSTRIRRHLAVVAFAPTAATTLVFIPALLRDPSTTEAVPAGWLVALLLAGPLTAYLASRLFSGALDVTSAHLVGLPQLPLILLLSAASIWLDVQRGHLLAGSGEEAMSYAIGMPIAFVAGMILVILVGLAARLGARPSK